MNGTNEKAAMEIGISNIVTAFDDKAVGSRVIWPEVFKANMRRAIASFDWDSCSCPGQAYIVMPTDSPNGVMPGNAPHTHDPDDYVVRKHRGRVGLYLKRPPGWTKVDHLAIVVYDVGAYLNDPDVDQKEAERIFMEGCTHVLVAILASSGPASPLSPSMLVHNLAGGNNEALAWTADQIRKKAKEIEEYQNYGMITVAD